MNDQKQKLNKDERLRLHDASMDILKNVGVAFHDEEATEIFKKNGFHVDEKTVYISEKDVMQALDSAPSSFTVRARNPENNVMIGKGEIAVAPGYGAPYISTLTGERRRGTLLDYENFCKLIQTSDQIDFNGYLMVAPSDRPADVAHLDMIASNILLCDKPFMASTASKEAAKDSLDMVGIAFGGKNNIEDKPVLVSIISAQSPLQFTAEMAGSLIEQARCGQACVIASMIMAGTSGPVTLAGVLVQQNAEILAGLTLAQLIRPGAPTIYGSASAPIDMKTGAPAIGAPEFSMLTSATAQMSRFYNLPSRGGGVVTDAHVPDAQAALESAFGLTAAFHSGINFVLHGCGILSSYMAMSYEKFLLDEEAVAMLRRMIKPIEINDETIDLETIKDVGIGGHFLNRKKTFERCWTEFFMPRLMKRQNDKRWADNGKRRIDEVASDNVRERLDAYQPPDRDPEMEKALKTFVAMRKEEKR